MPIARRLTRAVRQVRPPATAPVVFERRPTFATFATGLPELGLGVVFVITWVNPRVLGEWWVSYAVELLLVEFIMIHSAAFMSFRAMTAKTTRERVTGLLGFGAFYMLFIAGIGVSLRTWRPVVSWLLLTASRVWSATFDPPPDDAARSWFMGQMAMNVVLYLLLAGITTVIPFPSLGVREWMLVSSSDEPGLWSTNPERAVCFAAAYYVLRGTLTIGAWPRQVRRVDEKDLLVAE